MNLSNISPQISSYLSSFQPQELADSFEDVFKYISKDQTASTSSEASRWRDLDKEVMSSILVDYRKIDLKSDCLKHFEMIAYRLSKLVNIQLKYTNHKEREIKGEISNSKSSHSYLIKSASRLDDIFLTIFLFRFYNNDLLKAASAYLNLSDEAIKSRKHIFNLLWLFCDQKISEGKLDDLITLYNHCLSERNGLKLILNINKKLYKIHQNNKDIIQSIILALDSSYFMEAKENMTLAIQEKRLLSASDSIEILLFHPNYRQWCLTQLHPAIESKIEKQYHRHAISLVELLLKNGDTYNLGMVYIHEMIKKEIDEDNFNNVEEYIKKYLMNKAENLKYIISYYCGIIQKNQDLYFILKVESLVISAISSNSLNEHQKQMIEIAVKELSNVYTGDRVITLLSLAKIKLTDFEFIKKLANIFIQEMSATDTIKTHLVETLYS